MILFALQISPLDIAAAGHLASLISEIERKPSACQWLICYRQDTPVDRIWAIKRLLDKKFATVYLYRAGRHATGWPAGANALWLATMEYAAELYQAGAILAEGVLTFEPDNIPCRGDWMAVLEAAYSNRQKPVLGNVHYSEIPTHINGNAIFPILLLEDYPQMRETPVSAAWDFHHRELLLSIGEDTPYLTQLYQKKQLSWAEWRGLSKAGQRPALLHGVKDDSGRALARMELARNQLAPPKRLVVQP